MSLSDATDSFFNKVGKDKEVASGYLFMKHDFTLELLL